jgi:hypothetical protein
VVAVVLLGLAYGAGLLAAAVWLVGTVRRRRVWREPGLPLHELIAPTGELQDPQYGDRRLPRTEWAAAECERYQYLPLMARAPWAVQKGARSVHHG